MSTMECSCRLWPTPGIYVVTSIPLVTRTRATLRNAEFGFFGVCVYTRVQTPRFCGDCCNAGLAVLYFGAVRPLRTNWLNVGTLQSSCEYFANFLPPLTRMANTRTRARGPSSCSISADHARAQPYFRICGNC